jgi:hypothetical protein
MTEFGLRKRKMKKIQREGAGLSLVSKAEGDCRGVVLVFVFRPPDGIARRKNFDAS